MNRRLPFARFSAGMLTLACGLSTVDSFAQSEDLPSKVKDEGDAPPPHELSEVVIEGRLLRVNAPAPSTSTSLKAEDLETFEEDDIHQVLLKVPGVQIRGEDGAGLRPNIGIRGTSPNRSAKIALMEDGILFGPAPYSAPAAYYFPLVTRMSEVNVYKGGAQILYGPRALGGAIDLVTAPIPVGWGGSADVAVGQFNHKKIHGRGGYGSELTGFLLEAVHLDSNGFKDLDGGGNTGFDKNEFMAKWRLNSAEDAEVYHQIDMKLGFANEHSDETYLGLTDNDFQATPYRRYVASSLDEMNWYRGQARITYTVLPSDSLEFQFDAYRHQFSRAWFKVDSMGGASLDEILENPDAPSNRIYYEVLTGQANSASNDELIVHTDNQRSYISQGLQTSFLHQLATGPIDHELQGSVRLHQDEVNRHHVQSSYAMVGAASDQLGSLERTEAPETATTRNRGSAHALSIHLVDTIKYKSLTLTPGVRTEIVWTKFEDALDAENDNTRTQVGLIPGLGAHYAISDELGILAGVYRGFGPVAPQALTEDETLPKPESSVTWELGTRFASSVSHLELIGFFVDYSNLTANCSQSRGCSSQDVGRQYDGGEARVGGLESLLARKWRWGDYTLPLRASYALSFSSFRSEFTSTNPEWGEVEKGDQLPYLPTHSGSLGAGFGKEKRWNIDASATFVSAAREVAGQGEVPAQARTDPYALIGLSGRLRAVKHLWFYANVTNLLDSTYLTSRRPHGARPGAPRSVQVGLKIER